MTEQEELEIISVDNGYILKAFTDLDTPMIRVADEDHLDEEIGSFIRVFILGRAKEQIDLQRFCLKGFRLNVELDPIVAKRE